MEFDRRVQIRVYRPEREPGFGTGYLVAPRLVLTAAHVLGKTPDPRARTITVRRPDAGAPEFRASELWYRNDDAVDAALIEVDEGTERQDWEPPESLMDLRARPPQRWGHLIGTRPHPAAVAGFPRMQREERAGDVYRLDEQLTATIRPGTGSFAGRYEIFSTDPTIPMAPPPNSKTATRWSGMSGASLLCENQYGSDLLCGVIRRDRQPDAGTRLTATPAASLLADPDFRSLLAHHTGWEPVLEPAEPAGLLAPAARERDLRSAAMLLRADAEAVTFHGREEELQNLLRWSQDRDTFAVRIITGPGGQGKTRLARHLTDTLRSQGWITGHLRANLADNADHDLSGLETADPLMLVIDYAETLPRLLRHLIEHLRTARHRVRLVLLARSDGAWRTDNTAFPTLTAPSRELLRNAPVDKLDPLVPRSAPPRARAAAFTRATADLSRLLNYLPAVSSQATDWRALAATIQPPDDLNDPRYDSALTLQMTALITLLQSGPAPVPTTPGEPAEATLLSHEERYWGGTAITPAFQLSGLRSITLHRAVAVASLCGAADPGEAEVTAGKIPGLPSSRATDVAEWLNSLYPPSPDRYWGSLQPDRLAEYHCSGTLTDARTLAALLTDAAEHQQTQLITVLIRAIIAHYNAGRTDDSSRVLNTLTTTLSSAPVRFDAIENASATMPYAAVIAPIAVLLTSAVASTYWDLTSEDPERYAPDLATALDHYSIWTSMVGQRADALAAQEWAVKIYGRLAATKPATYKPELADSLIHLAERLAALGRHTEALNAARQAEEIYRSLPAEYASDLALPLAALAMRLREVGRLREAQAAVEKAVAIQRQLVADNPSVHEAGLAEYLGCLATCLADLGRRVEALAANREATEIIRRLAAGDRAGNEASLAASLSNLGLRLGEMGRHAEALPAEEQATEIRRRLAADNPAAHEPDLAGSLNNLGLHLSWMGRYAEALTATEQAVEIYRRLTSENVAYQADLAMALSNLAVRLGGVGREAEAVPAIEQSVEIRRRLAAENPAAYEPDLAVSLSNLGCCLSEVGRHAEALTTEEQAVRIYRRLAAENPTAYEPGLALSLSNLGYHLSAMGRHTEAVLCGEESVKVYRRLVAEIPSAHEPSLAASLNRLGFQLSSAGRHTKAVTAAEQATEIWCRLAAENPAYEPELALSLNNLGSDLTAVGRHTEALIAVDQALEILRRLAVSVHATTTNRYLRITSETKADVLDGLGRTGEAEEIRRWLADEGTHGTGE
ncbi:tetratricopeptide repeat protein [Streptomyces collinus]|uniref:tetratricopeptide repeat protein n=1 Tax=Streptomyces collinus TaxID=42684 RepID=UPI003830F083